MRKRNRKVWIVSPLFYLMAVAMAVMAVLTYRYNKAVALVELTAAVVALLSVLVTDLLYRWNVRVAIKSAKRY